MKGFCTLASGSKGNSLYFGTDKTKILVDVGLSVKTLKEKLENKQVELENIDAIFITHEHSDHIKGLEQIVKLYDIPVIANHETAKAICSLIDIKPRFKIFCTGENFSFQDLTFKPFSIQHDTVDPVGFIIEANKMKLGLCTDLGCVTTTVLNALRNLDFLILEANHKVDLVHASSRPDVYKQRVLSRLGHLSNDESAKLISSVYHPGLKKVFLAHLSEECNTPTIAMETIRSHLDQAGIDLPLEIAFQDKHSSWVSY
jgi:phosphoribosyl 1,2-cyclic phosphodiesterase